MGNITDGTTKVATGRARRGLVALVAAASMLGAIGLPANVAYAATEEELKGQLSDAQGKLDDATAEVKRLEGEMEAAETRIAAITKQLPDRRDAAADTMKALYKEMSTHNLQLDIILNSDNVDSIMQQLTALEDVQKTSFGQINSLTGEVAKHAADNVERKEELKVAKATVEKKTEEVADIEARLERVRNAPPAIEGCEPIDWSMSDEEIVAEWAPRIDAYLEGHALEGHGEDFVRAGIKYGVDPRFSAAISNTESTRGDACFVPNQPFGWMTSQTFDSFTASIYAHAEYLSGPLYNSKLNAQTAQTYCPPTWQSWLSNTLSAAQSI